MNIHRNLLPALAAVMLANSAVLAQSETPQTPDAVTLMAEQRAAMERFAWMDGNWEGTVTMVTPEAEKSLTQTERAGTMIDGTARIVEGRGYDENGALVFNAVALIGYDAFTDSYTMTSSTRGFVSNPWFEATESGFRWGMDNGPVKITYEAVWDGETWIETGYSERAGRARTKFMEMRLRRTGESTWPAEGAIVPAD